jgi:hypothetical protein
LIGINIKLGQPLIILYIVGLSVEAVLLLKLDGFWCASFVKFRSTATVFVYAYSVFLELILSSFLQMFNDNILKINVKRCVRMAVKLRKKYLHKVNSDMNTSKF